jgi:hypothetical protein
MDVFAVGGDVTRWSFAAEEATLATLVVAAAPWERGGGLRV